MVEVASPYVVGALVKKGAAHLVDSRVGDRHLEDAIVLFASEERVSDLDFDPAMFSGGPGAYATDWRLGSG